MIGKSGSGLSRWTVDRPGGSENCGGMTRSRPSRDREGLMGGACRGDLKKDGEGIMQAVQDAVSSIGSRTVLQLLRDLLDWNFSLFVPPMGGGD